MKKIRGSTLAKVLAIFLLLALAVVFAGCLLGAAFLYELGAYPPGGAAQGQEALLNRLGADRLRVTAHMAADRLAVDPLAKEQRRFDFYYADDFLYVLTDENGRTLVDQLGDGESLWSGSYTLRYTAECLDQSENFWHVLVAVIDSDGLTRFFAEYNFSNGFSPDGDVYYVYDDVVESTPSPRPSVAMPEISETPEADEAAAVPETDRADNTSRSLDEVSGETVERTYTLTGYLMAPLDEEDSFLLSLYSALLPFRVTLLWAGLGALVLCLLLFVFLMCAAGHRDGSDAVTPNFSDKVPADLFALVVGGGAVMLAFFGVQIIGECFNYNRTDPFLAALGVGFILAGAALALWLCMSFATRLKLGTVIKSCLCWKLLVLLWRVLKAACRFLARLWRRFWQAVGIFLRNVPLLWKAILFVGVLLLAEFIVIMSTDYDLGVEVFLWFVESAVLSLAFFYAILCLRRLQKGLREMAGGNTDFRVDTRHLHGDFLASAEDLNSVQVGIARAVNERMKSERFKTELITNVSHDIKTPLTSIINYVDLLGKEEPENEQMREYIEVLSRQSARLKKLIEDLIEASKASSGALSVSLERCDLGVLLDQTAGEYGEKLLASGLELLMKKPEEPVEVMADRRHIWRIFDNLMNNVCKYAQPGTRVYLDLTREGGKAVVTFRNISHSQLNISGEELMERFVRGDSSRNTEGSGLGLSIARSLAQLQRGSLDLTVDGDLFKVTLRFDAV